MANTFQPIMGAPQNHITPMSGVQDSSASSLLGSLSEGATAALKLFKNSSKSSELTAAEREDLAVSPYSSAVSELSTQLRAGEITRSEFDARLTTFTKNSISSTPNLASAIMERQKTILEGYGITTLNTQEQREFTKTTKEEDRRIAEEAALDKALMDNGIDPDTVDKNSRKDAVIAINKHNMEIASLKQVQESLKNREDIADSVRQRETRNVDKRIELSVVQDVTFGGSDVSILKELAGQIATMSLTPDNVRNVTNLLDKAQTSYVSQANMIADPSKREATKTLVNNRFDSIRAVLSDEEVTKAYQAASEQIAAKYGLTVRQAMPAVMFFSTLEGAGLGAAVDIVSQISGLNDIISDSSFSKLFKTQLEKGADAVEAMSTSLTTMKAVSSADMKELDNIEFGDKDKMGALVSQANKTSSWMSSPDEAVNSVASLAYVVRNNSTTTKDYMTGMNYLKPATVSALASQVAQGNEKANKTADMVMSYAVNTLASVADDSFVVENGRFFGKNQASISFDTGSGRFSARPVEEGETVSKEAMEDANKLTHTLNTFVSLKAAHEGLKDMPDEKLRMYVVAALGYPAEGPGAEEIYNAVKKTSVPLSEAAFISKGRKSEAENVKDIILRLEETVVKIGRKAENVVMDVLGETQ